MERIANKLKLWARYEGKKEATVVPLCAIYAKYFACLCMVTLFP